MLENPVYVRLATHDEQPYLKQQSAAEVVISVVASAQKQGWMRLHGFVVLPDALEIVCTPIKQGVSGVMAHIQAETIPLLIVLAPEAGLVWARRFAEVPLKTQLALDARLKMLLLSPVAGGMVEAPEQYPYSSANARYSTLVVPYAGFRRTDNRITAIDNTNHPE